MNGIIFIYFYPNFYYKRESAQFLGIRILVVKIFNKVLILISSKRSTKHFKSVGCASGKIRLAFLACHHIRPYDDKHSVLT